VPDLLARGVTVGLGTDGPASNNNLDMFEEMDTAAKVHKLFRSDPTVMPAREVFRMATRGGAKALGLDSLVGSLEVGKRADVVLIDLNQPELTPMYDVYSHLVYAIKGANVRTVVIDGRVVVRDRKMTTLDERKVMEKAREIQKRILESLK
jgi:5-methylthioadenosine/S-adenosylhomocysteine deaminase